MTSGGDRVANGEDSFPQDGLPSRPVRFSVEENAFWTLLMDQIPNELLRRVDSHQLATLCECMAVREVLYAKVKADLLDKTLFSHYMRTVQQIQRLSPVFGLGPIDRRRMKLQKTEEHDDAEEWTD